MANVKAQNTIYVDTTGTIAVEKNLRISMILLTPTAANGTLLIQDSSSQNRLKLGAPTSGKTERFDLVGSEIGLSNGLKVTITNATATIITASRGG